MNFKKKNFVFSSVGENTNFHDLWIGDNMDYDIYIIYFNMASCPIQSISICYVYTEYAHMSSLQLIPV